MDEASQLVAELQRKLAELDRKVWKYGQDMAAEFEKYSEELLRNVSHEVSETVSRTIVEAMKDTPSLYPAGTGTGAGAAFPFGETCACATTGTTPSDTSNGRSNRDIDSNTATANPLTPTSPMSLAPRQQDGEMDGRPRSPHARDVEFRGLFTPSYLPLLDNSSQRRSSRDRPTSPPPPPLTQRNLEPLRLDEESDEDTRSVDTDPDDNRPPTPRRKNTDEASVLSNTSDHSEGAIRRSALRRSSSASKDRASPRRVRFEVAGEEVLPTSSPAPMSEGERGGLANVSSDEEDDADEMIEDIDKPPPKRISSSQALRALSRSPFIDDGTQWTTVTAPPDGSASVAVSGVFSPESSSEDLYMGNGVSKLTLGVGNGGGALARNPHPPPVNDNDSTDELSEDEDVLDMPPVRRQSATAASLLLPMNAPPIHENKSVSASTKPRKLWQGIDNFGLDDRDITVDELEFNKEDDDDDGLFHFDDPSGLPRAPPTPQRYPDYDDEERDSFGTDSPTSRGETREGSTGYSTSPAISIARPGHADAPSASYVGSLRGQLFNLPIVSPEVHAHGAAFGPLDSFVGSVDGRSGLDASKPQSYRASVSFSGTPKSLSERMMMEDMMEANRNRRR